MKRLYILLLLVLTLLGCSTNKEITDRKEIYFWGKMFLYVNKYDKAISILRDAAEKDYVPAQYDLGIIYLFICKDYAKAYYWLNEAASQYYSPAQYFMGTLYEQGLGFEKNDNKAIEWYEKASNPTPEGPYSRIPKFDRKWSAQAKYRLGMIYYRQKKNGEAFECFHSAARQKNDSAMFQLGMMYEEGIGIHKDNKKAAYYYSKVAKKDYYWSWGVNGSSKDGSYHVGNIKVPMSHRDAQYRYARICHDGRIGFHNYTMARKFYQKAASSGHAQAQRELGLMYKRGQGGKQDRQQALQWLSKAAQQGDAEAQYHTAVLLEQEKDSTQALDFYRKSWLNGYKVNESLLKKRGVILNDSNVVQSKSKRMALLIGNDDYPGKTLINPRNDVWSLKERLNKLGFETRLFINLKSRAMKDSIESFYKAAKKSEVTLFFFAGHGSQNDSEIYLYPAHNIKDDRLCVKLSEIINKLQDNADEHNIIIVDACRLNLNNKKLSSEGKGLPHGLLLSLSTDINNVAEDGYNRLHSPYMEALLNELDKPGLSISDIFANVKKETEKNTNGSQVPSNIDNLSRFPDIKLNVIK